MHHLTAILFLIFSSITQATIISVDISPEQKGCISTLDSQARDCGQWDFGFDSSFSFTFEYSDAFTPKDITEGDGPTDGYMFYTYDSFESIEIKLGGKTFNNVISADLWGASYLPEPNTSSNMSISGLMISNSTPINFYFEVYWKEGKEFNPEDLASNFDQSYWSSARFNFDAFDYDSEVVAHYSGAVSNVQVTEVPEPSIFVLLLLALAGLILYRRAGLTT